MSSDFLQLPEDTEPRPKSDEDDILSIEEFELPARALSIGAQGLGRSQSQYELIAGIAKGGMGEIFLAHMTKPHEPI